MIKLAFFVMAALISSGAMSAEMCRVLTKSNTWVTEPCTETPIPCAKEWTDEKGRRHSETVPCAPGKQKTIEQEQREEDAAKKSKCGKDFMALRVGMTLDRFEECHEALSYVTETTDKNGLIETYRSTFYIIHFAKGRVVSYTRRTR